MCYKDCSSPPGQAGWIRSSCPDDQVSWGPGPGCPVCWWPSALWCCHVGRSRPAGWWAPALFSEPRCLRQHRRQNEHLVVSRITEKIYTHTVPHLTKMAHLPILIVFFLCCIALSRNVTSKCFYYEYPFITSHSSCRLITCLYDKDNTAVWRWMFNVTALWDNLY